MIILDEKEVNRLKSHGWKVEELGAKKSERQVFTIAEDLGAEAIDVIYWGTGRALQDVAKLEGYDVDFSVVSLPSGKDIIWIWKNEGFFQAALITPPSRR